MQGKRSELKEIKAEGVVTRESNQYVITTDNGTKFNLSAIMPWESVAADYGTDVFASHFGKRVIAVGMTDGHTIWKVHISSSNHD